MKKIAAIAAASATLILAGCGGGAPRFSDAPEAVKAIGKAGIGDTEKCLTTRVKGIPDGTVMSCAAYGPGIVFVVNNPDTFLKTVETQRQGLSKAGPCVGMVEGKNWTVTTDWDQAQAIGQKVGGKVTRGDGDGSDGCSAM